MKKIALINRPSRIAILAAVVIFSGQATYLQLFSSAESVIRSQASGNWSNASIWEGGKSPKDGDDVVIASNHAVVYDVADSKIGGVTVDVGAELSFSPNSNAKLRLNRNFVVDGKLTLKPSSDSVNHEIGFEDIDELAFVGGGFPAGSHSERPYATDVGLWVMGEGQIDINGAQKTKWVQLAQEGRAGQATITLKQAPSGWKVGDTIAIAPTTPPSADTGEFHQNSDHAQTFDETTITAVSGSTVTLSSPLQYDHPMVTFDDWNGQSQTYGAEVMNLNRNVKIHGETTANGSLFRPEQNGRSHIMLHSSKPQFILNAEIYNMGPRKLTQDGRKTDSVLGRYPLHWHHGGNGSRGSLVEGTVIHHSGSHAYVPHESHGVTIKDNVSYDTLDTAYWWDVHQRRSDEFPVSHGILLDGNIAAKVYSEQLAEEGYRMSGFELASGDNETNIARNNVAVGIYWEDKTTFASNVVSGFIWGERSSEKTGRVWQFDNNFAHNIGGSGLFGWQNSKSYSHIITNTTAYHNGNFGIEHGAYSNYYQYHNMALYGNRRAGIGIHATSRFFSGDKPTAPSLIFNNAAIDGGGLTKYAVYSGKHRNPSAEGRPTILQNIRAKGYTKAAFAEAGHTNQNRALYDVLGATVDDANKLTLFDGSAIGTQFRFVDLNKNGKVFTVTSPGDGVGNTTNNGNAPADYTLPVVNITSPTRGEGVRGVQKITASATDSSALNRVEFYIDDQLIRTVNSTPYEIDWDVQNLQEDKQYTVSVLAYDAAGNRGEQHMHVYIDNNSSMINIRQVSDTNGNEDHDHESDPDPESLAPVTVQITSPSSGSGLTGQVTVSAESSDPSRTVQVEFEIDSALIGTDKTAPYTISFDSATYSNGLHFLTARVIDLEGDESSGDPIEITINNANPGEEPGDAPEPEPEPVGDTEAPQAPTNVRSVNVTFNSVELTWDAATDNVAVAQYEVLRSGLVLATTNSLTYTDTSVDDNTSYVYTIRARDEAGNASSPSSSVDVATPIAPDTTPPSSVQGLSANADAEVVALNWTASTDDRSTIEYLVQRDGATIAIVNTTSHTDQAVQASTSYSYRVIARDSAGNLSQPSSSVSVTTPPPVPQNVAPSQPKNITIKKSGPNLIVIGWDASQDDKNGVYYEVYRNGTRIGKTKTRGNNTEFGDGTVRSGRTYEYYVVAVDSDGEQSEPSEAINGTAAR